MNSRNTPSGVRQAVAASPSDAVVRPSRRARTDRHKQTGPLSTLIGAVKVNPKGFGFCCPVEGDDAFIPPPVLQSFFDGDQIAATIRTEPDGRRTVVSAKLISRSRTHVVGTVVRNGKNAMLRVDPFVGNALLVLVGPNVVAHRAVLAELRTNGRTTTAQVVTDLGHNLSPEALRTRVLNRLGVPAVDDDTVAHSGGTFPGSARRVDLRHLPTITIDGPSTKDIDDAISCAANADGSFRVWVHIADVGEVVAPRSALATAIMATATSVYLPDWNRPMLPRALSENRCSLLPHQKRLTVTAAFTISSDGHVSDIEMFETIINSDARLTYTQVSDFLNGDTAAVPSGVAATVLAASCAAAAMTVSRRARGGLSEGRSDADFEVGTSGDRVVVRPATPSTIADDLIERLMVAANEAVGEWLTANDLTGVRRTHAQPDRGAMDRLGVWSVRHGFDTPLEPHPVSLAEAALAVALAGGTAAAGWQELMMSGLSRARYTTETGTHFGLGSSGYLHFTSPIRRLADLAVHWVIKASLRGLDVEAVVGDLDELAVACDIGSGVASRAESQTRKAFWMTALGRADRTDTYDAVVTGVNAKGAFITLDGSFVSGVCSWSSFGAGPWVIDEHRLTASSPERVISLGDPVSVRVERADVERGQLDLAAA